MNEEQNLPEEELEFAPASDDVKKAVADAVESHRDKSFAGRNPQLGKMINCGICKARHRSHIKCEQVFAVKHYEQEFNDETGEYDPEVPVFATAAHTKRGVYGAQAFKGKRIKPHLNRRAQMFIERVRKIFTASEDIDQESELFKEALKIARKKAARQLRKEYRVKANEKRDQQELSRRINEGLL
jgi:hypothetical protein